MDFLLIKVCSSSTESRLNLCPGLYPRSGFGGSHPLLGHAEEEDGTDRHHPEGNQAQGQDLHRQRRPRPVSGGISNGWDGLALPLPSTRQIRKADPE